MHYVGDLMLLVIQYGVGVWTLSRVEESKLIMAEITSLKVSVSNRIRNMTVKESIEINKTSWTLWRKCN